MDKILNKLFWTLEDNINDSKYFYEYYKECYEHYKETKEQMHSEMAQYFLNEAKNRIDKNETVKNKIDYIVKNQAPEMQDSPYKLFYDFKLEECHKLKEKYSKASI